MSYSIPLYAGVSTPSVRRYPSAVKMTDDTAAQLTEVDSDQDVISRVMAGERDAFAMLIGIITGSYSSIFVAAPILIDLAKSKPLGEIEAKPLGKVEKPKTALATKH